MKTVFIIGAGYVAGKAASLLLDQGYTVSLGKRHPEHGIASELRDRVKVHAMDVQKPATFPLALLQAQVIIYCVASDGFSPEQYRAAYSDGLGKVLQALGHNRSKTDKSLSSQRLIFVSSTGVFSQEDGSRVDEHSIAEPKAFSGRIMRDAELALQEFADRTSRFDACSIRFSGIYGPGRTRMIQEIAAGKPVARKRWMQLTNRIHRDDCASALAHLVKQDQIQSCYVASDTHPATFGEIATWLAARLGVSVPSIQEEPTLQEASTKMHTPPPKASGGLERGGHKACWSTGLLAEGFAFRFPSFKEGYDSLIRTEAL
jgi:nucleoside-diphosphate-sugar epimerase